MDRWETDSSPITSHGSILQNPRAADLATIPDQVVGALLTAGAGWKVRIDSGHHRSRSRWLGRDLAHRGARSRVLAADSNHASVVVASRGARVLAAMIRAILGTEANQSDQGSLGGTCLVTVRGPTPADPVGVVQFRPPAQGLDYLLTHAAGGECLERSLVERYSREPGHDWWAGDVKGVAGRYRFRVYHRGHYQVEIRLQAPGAHHVLPALAAVAVGFRMDVSAREIKDRLEEFLGVPRGFESHGTFRGATLVDDEATESGGISDALGLAREVFGGRTIRAVYLPDLASGLDPGPSPVDFEEANHLILVDRPLLRTDSTRLLAASLRSSGASVVSCSSLDMATQELDRGLEPGDVLMMLGAGEVGTIADAFLRRLSRNRHG